jgi:hypothetical protein
LEDWGSKYCQKMLWRAARGERRGGGEERGDVAKLWQTNTSGRLPVFEVTRRGCSASTDHLHLQPFEQLARRPQCPARCKTWSSLLYSCKVRFVAGLFKYISLRDRSTPAVARKIPFDDPQVLNYVRIAYVTAQAIILGTYFFTAQKVRPSSSRALFMRSRLHFAALSDQVEERPDGAQIR